MINKLRQLFPSAVYEENLLPSEKHLYTVYVSSHTSESFAIKTGELNEREEQLLELSFHQKSHSLPFHSGNPEWYSYFNEDGPRPASLKQYNSFRLFYLQGRKLYENQTDLHETLRYYFDEQVKTVFLEQNFLIVLLPDQKHVDPEMFEAGELAGILAADLLLDVFIYSGRRIHQEENIKYIYLEEKQLFQMARNMFPKERTFRDYEILPFILPLLEKPEQQHLYHYALAGLEKETELVDTLYYFFLCNLNSSLTAKELHMHRNTLQYRLEKVSDRIGIDVKHFPNAAALYILIKKIGN
ncbi:PucR family transcriptional regulator [Salibacterium aidingense]|uniref:PucR family transcriptional regulator n=1 Tax=Salibacterium aidingense TaxID=384933 RepID=UPI003BC22596